MFTGIISHLGIVLKLTSKSLTLSTPVNLIEFLKKGSSIAVNGVCLTIVNKRGYEIHFDVMPETWKKTALGDLRRGESVNLELPLLANGRFEGHIVQGHIDGVAHVKSITSKDNSETVTYQSDRKLTQYMVPKGSVAIDGISLTLIKVDYIKFSVGIIPYTLSHTNMESIAVGKKVNIEVDILSKYIEKFIERRFHEKAK